MTLNACQPIIKIWLFSTPGYCFNYNRFIMGTNVTDLFLDIAVLALPIRSIFKLQVTDARKIMLCAIFLVGGL